MHQFYGTDNYEWNHYKLPKGEICDVSRDESFIRIFLHSLYMSSEKYVSVNMFLPMSKNYLGEKENHYDIVDDPLANENDSKKFKRSKDCFYLNLLYAIRHALSGEYSHTEDFSCINEDMLRELKGIKQQISFDRRHALFETRLHLVNDALASYRFFLKVYVIQKKNRFLNLGDQNKIKGKAELTSCVSNQFNGMYIVRTIYQESRRKDYIPIYIFIDCAVSFKQFDNYYFSKNPKAAFIAHYYEEGKNTKMKETFQCHYCDIFFRYKGEFLKHIKYCSGRPGFVCAF